MTKCARVALTVAVLFAGTCGAHGSETLTPEQKNIACSLIRQDLETYLAGGQSLFSDVFSQLAPPEVLDQEIAQQYLRNAIAADLAYKGKAVFVSGTFVGVENWISDVYRVQLIGLVAEVPKQDADFLASAHQGQKVEMACNMEGKEIDFVHVSGCESADIAKSAIVNTFVDDYLTRAAGKKRSAKVAFTLVKALDSILPPDSECRKPDSSQACIEDVTAVEAMPAFKDKLAQFAKERTVN